MRGTESRRRAPRRAPNVDSGVKSLPSTDSDQTLAKRDRSPVLYFPVNNRDNKAPLKAWSLLLDTGTDSLIVPLPFLDAARRDLEVRVGGTRISIQYDRERNLLNCKGQVGSVTCVSGYYFALRTFYPEAKVYSPKSETKKAASQ